MTRNHYQTLDISRDASHQEIKKAFRALALRYHPDVTDMDKNLASERFKLSRSLTGSGLQREGGSFA